MTFPKTTGAKDLGGLEDGQEASDACADSLALPQFMPPEAGDAQTGTDARSLG